MLMRALEFGGIAAFSATYAWAWWRLAASGMPNGVALGVLALPVSYYLADLLTGLIHWVCDSFGSAATPLWGPLLVGPFRRHHADPLQITRITLLENLGSSAIAGTAALWGAHPPLPDKAAPPSMLAAYLWQVWLGLVLFAVLSNLFHRWAHIPKRLRPAWIDRLQRLGLILDAREHRLHHQRPYRRNYCILSGWANGLTNAVPWHRIEGLLARCGIHTNFD